MACVSREQAQTNEKPDVVTAGHLVCADMSALRWPSTDHLANALAQHEASEAAGVTAPGCGTGSRERNQG